MSGDGVSISVGGVAQLLFGGAVPAGGFEVCNVDLTEDLWLSDSTTAEIGGVGSYRLPGGGYTYKTPYGYKPMGPVSVIAATAGHVITARKWLEPMYDVGPLGITGPPGPPGPQGPPGPGATIPTVADGVWSPTTGATVAPNSDVVDIPTANFSLADVGKRFTMMRGGSPAFFGRATIANRGTGYRAGDAITIGSSQANVWSVTARGHNVGDTLPTIVNGGSGGPPNTQFIVKGLRPGRRFRRDAARITVETDGAGVVTSIVRVDKGGIYVDPTFTGINEPFNTTDYPDLTGLIINLTLGVYEIRRRAACFYGRVTGTTLTVEEMIYGTIAAGNSFTGIEVIEGTTVTAQLTIAAGSVAGGLGTYSLSTAHADMDKNIWLFVAETRTTTTSPPANPVSPTGGSGTGLSVTAFWGGTPLLGNIIAVLSPTTIRLDVTAASAATNVGYCYGTDHGPVIQAALDAGQEVNLPAGVICHSTPIMLRDKSRLLGKGSALGDNANTVLAYVGPASSRGKQVSVDEEAGLGRIGGMAVGELYLWGSNLIGIGFYVRGSGGNQIRPMSLNGHTYIGMQLTGGVYGASVGNIHSHMVIRENDAPGVDVTGIYIGPGAAPIDDPAAISYHDVCRTFFPYWQVDVNIEGFARAVWYRTADSNSHGFIKCRGAGDLPTMEFASHDTRGQFARSIHISYLDTKSLRLRGGAFPSEVGVSYQNFLNGGESADVDGTPEATEAIEADDPEVTVEYGANFFGISNRGTLNNARLQQYKYDTRQQSKTTSWQLLPITDANTNVPGAEITGVGSYSVLAFTDGAEALRVLQPQPLGSVANPTLLSSSSPTASAGAGTNTIRAIIPSGNLLYVVSSLSAGNNFYLNVLDVSNPAAPVEMSETAIALGQVSAQVQLAGSYLFVGTNVSANGVCIVDVSDPWAPVLVASINTGAAAGGLAVTGNILLVGSQTGGIFRCYNLAALPGVPPLIGTLTLVSVTNITQITVRGKFAYVTEDNATDTNLGLQIIDISTPTAPVLVGSYDASLGLAGDYDCRGLAISGQYAFTVVVVGGAGALHIVNIANPAAPVNAAVVALSRQVAVNASTLLLIGDMLHLTQLAGGNDIGRWDVSNPLLPVPLGGTPLGSDGMTLAASGNLMFVGTTGTAGNAAATPPTDPAKLYDNLKILQISGTQQESAAFGSLRADRVRLEHLDVDRDVRFNGGLSIGNQGLYSKGPIAGPATQTRVYTVATLPAGRLGMRAMVSDATAPAFLAAPVGGGAVRAPVFWDDGTSAWKVG